MQTCSSIHLTSRATVSANIVTDGVGRRYLTLTITDDGVAYPAITLFPEGPEFFDKLANECERAVREFVGDVPDPAPSQEYLDEIGERQSAEVAR